MQTSPLSLRKISSSTFALRVALALLMAAAGLLMTGCDTASSEASLLLFADNAPLPTIVPAGTELAAAEAAAAKDRGCFAAGGSGSSMEPVYLEGTAVVVRAVGYDRLHVGSPVVYQTMNGHRVAHMLVEKTDAGWVAAGLNNDWKDRELVTESNLVGVITQAFASKTGPLPKSVAARIALNEQIRRAGKVASLGM